MDKTRNPSLRFKRNVDDSLRPRHHHHHRHHHYQDQQNNKRTIPDIYRQVSEKEKDDVVKEEKDINYKDKDILAEYTEKFDIIEAPDFIPSDDESSLNANTINRIKGKDGHINLITGDVIDSKQRQKGFEAVEMDENDSKNTDDGNTSIQASKHNKSILDVDYTFGDRGSNWRMIKLENIIKESRYGEKSVESEAMNRYGDLALFYIAMEEREELQRRKRTRDKSKWVFKPTGRIAREHGLLLNRALEDDDSKQERSVNKKQVNEARIQMMKARIQKQPDFKDKEEKYKELKRKYDEVSDGKPINSAISPNSLPITEDEMSVEQLAKREHLMGSEEFMKTTAKQLAAVKSFDNADLDSQDEMASTLAKLESKKRPKDNLKALKMLMTNPKLAKAISRCAYCLTNNRSHPPVVKSTRSFYLSLMPRPEVTEAGCMIVPYEHIRNSLELDTDQADELKDMMTEISLLYFKKWHKNVIFYENSVSDSNHLTIRVVPLPISYKPDVIKTYFVNGILEHYDEATSTHKPVIDTMSETGQKYDSLIAKNAPFFHVWLTAEGGVGHIVEDSNWPKGDLFAREIIGGMLNVDEFVVHLKLRFVRDEDLIKKLRAGLGD